MFGGSKKTQNSQAEKIMKICGNRQTALAKQNKKEEEKKGEKKTENHT